MLRNWTNTASFFSVVMAALLFSLSLAGVAAAQSNTSLGTGALVSNTTSGDMAGILMIAVQTLEKRTAEQKQKETQIALLQSEVNGLKAKHAYFETAVARLEALELRTNQPVHMKAERTPGDEMAEAMP